MRQKGVALAQPRQRTRMSLRLSMIGTRAKAGQTAWAGFGEKTNLSRVMVEMK